MEDAILKIYEIIHNPAVKMAIVLVCFVGCPVALLFSSYQVISLLYTRRQMSKEKKRIERKHLNKVA